MNVTDYINLSRRYPSRHFFCKHYAFAIPDRPALEAIARHSPRGVVEIGAGTGYWALLLSRMGINVAALDTMESHFDRHARWFPVRKGGAAALSLYQDRTLFLCWPCYQDPMATICLRKFCGDTVIYIGEGRGGCTGDDEFHEILDREWTEVETVDIPRWDGIRDDLYIYRRN